jgi:outer membrane immunogenic protein
MKHTVLAIISALSLAPLSAQAADMAMKAPVPAPAPTSWTGCYVDGGLGYGLWDQKHTTSTTFAGVPGTTISQTDGGNGWLGRVGLGCDYQVAPRWVIGAFGQYDWMNVSGTNSTLEVTAAAPFAPVSATEKERSAWYAGARVGYLLTPAILTYAEAGYTATRFGAQSETTNLGAPIGFGFAAATYGGWFLGGGTETALADWLPTLPKGLFLRSDYRFSYYGSKTINELTLATGLPDGNSENTRPYVQTITTELVWRFNFLGH